MREIILLLTVSALSYITTSAQSTFTSSLAAKAKGDANIYGVVECDGNDVVPQFWAELSSDIEEIERHDFALKAVDNDRHVIVALAVMINVWNWGNDWKIKVTENGKELKVERRNAENPQMLIGIDIPDILWNQNFTNGKNKCKMSQNMFHVTASAPDTDLEITVTDRFGNEYHQTMVRPKAFHLHMK